MHRRALSALVLGVTVFSLLAILAGCGGQTAKNSPYGNKRLHPETVKLLDDPNYQNIILPDELADRLAKKEDLYVYFFSPACPHCKKTTPILVPVAKEFGVDLKMYNVLEFEQGWKDYNIEGTPTLVHFVNGQEKSRVVGAVDAETFRQWFREQKGSAS